jgi:phosphotransferase system enzyme I (PtsI)
MSTQRILKGHPVAPGIAIGPALVYRSTRRAPAAREPDSAAYEPMYARTTTREIERLNEAIAAADAALASAETQLRAEGQAREAAVFSTHRTLLADPALHNRAISLIAEEGWQAADAIVRAGEEQASVLEIQDDPEWSTRASDVQAVVSHIWRTLVGDTSFAEQMQQPAIVVANDIGPAELMSLPREHLLGIVLTQGGLTAHTAILVRAWSIPAIIGLGHGMLRLMQDGEMLAIDGAQGEVVVAPDGDKLDQMRAAADALEQHRHELRSQREDASITVDGRTITLLANVASITGARAAREWGAGGVGSLRTELLFVGRSDMPSEDDQVDLYLSIAAELPDLPIVVRTLDIGGDKQLPTFPLPHESNPFLGWRGIRIGLSRAEELLLPQLRAMLRAGASADIRIIAPMIATMQEWRQLRALFQQAHAELVAAGVPCAPHPQLGVLIEVPAAALIIEHLAREADFISIGSNDLVQYTLACDRTNPRVAHLYQTLEPSILHLIHTTTEAAHRHGRSVSLCGEMASDASLTALLVGLGIDELSCTPPALPAVRAAVRATNATEAQQLACQALQATTADEVRALLASVVAE